VNYGVCNPVPPKLLGPSSVLFSFSFCATIKLIDLWLKSDSFLFVAPYIADVDVDSSVINRLPVDEVAKPPFAETFPHIPPAFSSFSPPTRTSSHRSRPASHASHHAEKKKKSIASSQAGASVSPLCSDHAERCSGPGSWGIRTRHDPCRLGRLAIEDFWCWLRLSPGRFNGRPR
jgi:hypothetical protein